MVDATNPPSQPEEDYRKEVKQWLKEIEEEYETPPPLDPKTEKKLLQRLERATKLARKRKISDLHHAAIGIDTVMRLCGDAGRDDDYSIRGRRFSSFEIGFEAWKNFMARTGLSFEEGVARYGEFLEYVATLRGYQSRSRKIDRAEIEWDEEIESVLDEARLRLCWWNRGVFRFEEWVGKHERFFPRVMSFARTVVVALAVAALTLILTKTCSPTAGNQTVQRSLGG